MIRLIDNRDIDREKWDCLLLTEKYPKPYSFSWYLDIMAPGWLACIKGDYDWIMPVLARKKFGISYLCMPAFSQQFNISCRHDESSCTDEISEKLSSEFKLIDICIPRKPENKKFKVSLKSNYTLDLSRSYENIYKEYRRRCKRNIKLARSYMPEISGNCDPGEMVSLYRKNIGLRLPEIRDSDYSRLEKIIAYVLENNLGEAFCVRRRNGLIYASLIIKTGRTLCLFFISTTELSHNERIGYFVTDHIIRKFAGNDYMLDFAGSSMPSIAYYNSSYGAISEDYYRIYYNNLRWPIRLLKSSDKS